jgi:hypothetical protein
MSSIATHFNKAGNLLQALEAATNWRAMGMFIASLVAFNLLLALGAFTQSAFGVALMGLVGIIVLLVGLNATGQILMDQARGIAQRSFFEALLASLFTTHRLIGAAILEGIAFVGVLVLVAIVLAICKIPVLGPILYTFVFPLSALLLGLSFIILYIGFSLVAPAIWEGNGIIASLARLWTILRHRLPSIILSLILLALLTGLVSLVTFSIVMTGSMTVMSLSVPIIGSQIGGGLGSLFTNPAMLMSGFSFGEGGGYLLAGLIGGLCLYTVAASIPALVGIAGICQVYLQGVEGLDFDQAEAEISNRMEEAKRKAQEVQARAQAAAREMQTTTVPVSQANTDTSATHCPNCNAETAPDDMFCGTCGAKLKQ